MRTETTGLDALIHRDAESFASIDAARLGPLLDRIGDARIVLIGEASHGTAEFYRMRQRITRALIETKGFDSIAIEGDWPDVEHVDEYVRSRAGKPERPREAFSRFPTWMWRNTEVLPFIEWLRKHNAERSAGDGVGMYGLDLYSMYGSIHEVIEILERKGEHELARTARARYSGLLAYEPEPQAYGSAVYRSKERIQEDAVVAMLSDLLRKRLTTEPGHTEGAIFDAEQNARVIANGETYYREMFRGGRRSWNLRDSHMFEIMQVLLGARGEDSRLVVWAHNSHIGDARATEMGHRGEHNIGQLATETFGDAVYKIGFGTHAGTVAAADDWGEPVRIKKIKPSIFGSHERLCHQSEHNNFFLPLREARWRGLAREALAERAIGVVYRPDTEMVSHYFDAVLPDQFDEYIWIDETQALAPLSREHAPDLPEKHPFLLVD